MQLLKSSRSQLKSITTALLCFLAIAFASTLSAQSPFSAAYRVNSAVITYYEIDQTQRLLVALGRGGENPSESAVNELIDQRLLEQEAQRFGLEVDPVLVSRALENVSNGNPQKFRSDLNGQGIDNETIDSYIQNQILLRSYLDLRGGTSNVSPEEITERILQIPDQVTQVVNIAEIVMPYAEYGGRIPTRLRVSQLMTEFRNGKSFSQAAREVSRSPTASNGGRLQPIPREGLNGQIRSIIKGMRPGQIAAPIETEGAIILLQYVGISEVRNSLPRNPKVSYVELFVPANGNLAQSKTQAQQLSRQLTTCSLAKSAYPGGYREDVSVNSLSSGISLALARLESGESAIYEREDGTALLFLCDRGVTVPAQFDQGVQNLVLSEAVDARARGVLLELRNLANIERVQ